MSNKLIYIIIIGFFILSCLSDKELFSNTIEENTFLKKLNLLEVSDFKNKTRYGKKRDGGYVTAKLDTKYDCYISAGIEDEESFTRDFFKDNKYLKKRDCYAFDGTIDDYPWRFTKNITFIKKNINNYNDSKNTDLSFLTKKYNNIFLSMDIEGYEYVWLKKTSLDDLKKFAQIVIEIHGLTPRNKWGHTFKTKEKCLKKLSKTHYLVHAHGNNYAPVENKIPNTIELTYVNKKFFDKKPKLNKTKLPNYLDYPNILK